ncbi:MAG: biotin--[acetyl-CoA-carboxylase] ligase [Clostridiales bacterium]|nr:biotin--[acetyl-CoA-carboxylase] ligase [Clostridiales bacterium]
MKKTRVARYVTRAELKKYRTDSFCFAPTVCKRKTDSTNVRLKALAERGAEEGTLFLARTQTKGKGRMGRKFFSPKGNGLYFSLLLRPNLSAEEGGLITTAAAVAVCRALLRFGAENPQIKWVNDIFVNGKKVCGILTESHAEKGKIAYAVLGVGINLLSPKKGFDESIKNVAGAAFVTPVSPSAVLAAFLEEFSQLYSHLSTRPHYAEYLSRMLCVGEKVTMITADGELPVTVTGITQDFSLITRLKGGEERIFSQGEISLRPTTQKE